MRTPKTLLQDRLLTAMERKGMSKTALALAIGKDRNYIRDFYSGKKKSLSADAISLSAGVLDTTPDWLQGHQSDGVRSTLARTIPLYGAQFIDSDGRFTFEHVADVLCPPQLVRVAKPYAVSVSGDTMAPRYKPGMTVILNPARVAKPDDDVIIMMADGEDSPHYGYLKEVVAITDDKVTLRQLNPEKRMTIARERISAMHVVNFIER